MRMVFLPIFGELTDAFMPEIQGHERYYSVEWVVGKYGVFGFLTEIRSFPRGKM